MTVTTKQDSQYIWHISGITFKYAQSQLNRIVNIYDTVTTKQDSQYIWHISGITFKYAVTRLESKIMYAWEQEHQKA